MWRRGNYHAKLDTLSRAPVSDQMVEDECIGTDLAYSIQKVVIQCVSAICIPDDEPPSMSHPSLGNPQVRSRYCHTYFRHSLRMSRVTCFNTGTSLETMALITQKMLSPVVEIHPSDGNTTAVEHRLQFCIDQTSKYFNNHHILTVTYEEEIKGLDMLEPLKVNLLRSFLEAFKELAFGSLKELKNLWMKNIHFFGFRVSSNRCCSTKGRRQRRCMNFIIRCQSTHAGAFGYYGCVLKQYA
ncbi:hypothetical protein DAPPUDRAFT_244197 [Daphnia pulex]|uniref:Uncharacterized protein n=1 Tax=Daphnia pulex TaxID=6669 RepID=E9GKF3_DAPPU|nr:hypothetical protein DAPPUDRAFT_244197 [Daphnia pulex]|eukprot:EFX79983.1 hypothetical protein DAPPUDRAFT_244197 [Daphnia pulex]